MQVQTKEIDYSKYKEGKWVNYYTLDPNFVRLMEKYLPAKWLDWAHRHLTDFGQQVGGPIAERSDYTDKAGRPVLNRYNRLGEDISEIWTNDGYKQTVKEVYEAGIVGYLYHPVPELGEKLNYMFSYAMGYILSQTEAGFYCPVTLTLSSAYLVDRFASEELKEKYLTRLTSLNYETLYEGTTWLTEKQGGSDVGSNTTRAVRVGEVHLLTGEKFFASNAGAGVSTLLARVNDRPGTKGLGLFLVPWRKENGERNQISVRRLKDKLGVIAVPSAEVLLEDAEGYLIGEEEKGFKYMIEALNISRMANAVASVGILRRAFLESVIYATHREAFGQPIIRYPMLQEMLLDLLIDLEATTAGVFKLIYYYDKEETSKDASEDEKVINRLLVSLMKYRAGEVVVRDASKAIEIHGGNGYIEEYVTPRLLRDAQVLTVWEGTANILGLDLLRAIEKHQAHEVFSRELERIMVKLTHPYSRKILLYYQEELKNLRETVSVLVTQPKEMQIIHPKRLADWMVDLYQGVVLLEDAEFELSRYGDARKFLVAKVYTERLQRRGTRGILNYSYLEHRFFKELVNYQILDEGSLASHI